VRVHGEPTKINLVIMRASLPPVVGDVEAGPRSVYAEVFFFYFLFYFL
jgi:hypothetical protein